MMFNSACSLFNAAGLRANQVVNLDLAEQQAVDCTMWSCGGGHAVEVYEMGDTLRVLPEAEWTYTSGSDKLKG